MTYRIRTEAARWFTRMKDAEVDHPDRARFEAWLLSSQAHADAYVAIADTWQDFDTPHKVKALADAVERKKSQELHESGRRTQMMGRVAACIATLAISCVLYFGVRDWYAQPVEQLARTTAIGQIMTQKTTDGSEIVLNADTSLDITYYRDRRLVRLDRGHAIFTVSRDENRPFVVDSGIARITVLGTRFSVNRIQGKVIVSVDHGRVKVEEMSPGSDMALDAVILVNGEVAQVQPEQKPQRLAQNAMDAFAFTRGQLVFEKASLDEIAETFTRYRRTPVHVVHGAGASPKITAVVKINDIESFLNAMPKIAPVTVKHLSGETVLGAK
jgi:transmembrane sensor